MPDVLEFPYPAHRLHTTQSLWSSQKTWIRAFTGPGQVVLDPFCGSGSTLVAAHERERRFIGIDIDPVHCRTARKRLMIAEGCLAATD